MWRFVGFLKDGLDVGVSNKVLVFVGLSVGGWIWCKGNGQAAGMQCFVIGGGEKVAERELGRVCIAKMDCLFGLYFPNT